MSDDYSSFERDYFRKSKRRQDFKPHKISPKQIKVYEPKSAQKTLKSQEYADEPDFSPPYEDDYYDEYTKSSKKETYKIYVSKTASSSKSKQGGNTRFSDWKKEIAKVKKGAGESQKATSPKGDTEWVVSPKTTLFFEEKSATVNNLNPKTLPAETKHSSGEDSSMISAGLSTTANTDDRRSSEMFDFAQDRPDPIQAMKALRRKANQGEEKAVNKDTTKEEEVDKGKESTKDESNMEVKEESEKVSEDKELEIGEAEEDEENNYSDIDGLMEKKLLNNEVEINSDEDAFNEAQTETRKRDLGGLDNEERPLWEDLDTNKMLEDIKKFDHLPMFSQDIKSSWKGKALEVPQGNKEQKRSQDIWFKDRNAPAEEDDDDFEKFFSLKTYDESDDIVPNIFHIWHKASSDKQARGTSPKENRLMKSQSFDSEIIKRKDTHTPLPAFKNYCIQQEANKEEPPTTQTPPSNSSSKPKDSPNPAPKSIFKALVPNQDAKLWYYRDLQGSVQGPFTGQMMDEWYSRGYLPLDLDITIASSSGYRKLRELAEIAAKNSSNSSSVSPVVQPNKGTSPTQYLVQTPNKVLSTPWTHNQDTMNRDYGNIFNKGNGVLSSQLTSPAMTGPKQPQVVNIFSNMKPIQQQQQQQQQQKNMSEHQKNGQTDNGFNAADNSKRILQNVIAENLCPNLNNFNIFANNLAANNGMTPNKNVRTNPQQLNQAQIHLSYPIFNSQFDNYKGMNSNQVIPSSYRPQQMMNFNQVQGFDGSKVEANSNNLRNLPR
jgi:hypothetical protein